MGLNAQTIVPTFTAGQVLTAAQQNQINTGVPVFATTVTRDAAFGGSGEKTLAEGQLCYIEGTPNRLQVYDGSAWLNVDTKFTTFTPTWTNLTVGNATQVAQYIQIGKFVYVEGQITFGSTTSMSTNPTLAYPITVSSTTRPDPTPFMARISDAGTTTYYAVAECGGSGVIFYNMNVGGTYPVIASVNATTPMTWTTNDILYWTFSYEAA